MKYIDHALLYLVSLQGKIETEIRSRTVDERLNSPYSFSLCLAKAAAAAAAVCKLTASLTWLAAKSHQIPTVRGTTILLLVVVES